MPASGACALCEPRGCARASALPSELMRGRLRGTCQLTGVVWDADGAPAPCMSRLDEGSKGGVP